MADEGFERKLAAIFSADVEGYSRLMDDDEEATVRTLIAYRTAISDLVQQYRGHVVDSPGDNILAEFKSVVDAVNCAVEIQRDLAERNAELPDNRKMRFRIGVNLGDVIDEDGRIYGDGVNIAARVESLAEAGGICISGRAHDQVENKLGLEYEDLGKHEVKNISRPIQVYRVLSYPGAAAHRVVQAKEALGRRWRKIGFSAAAIVIVAVGIEIWQFYLRRPSVEPASTEKATLPLPDDPSIAVLPFENLSGDPKQDYFSDGITEHIITSLSNVPNIFVIARNSTFIYKNRPVKVQQVAEELGVRYVLEGSVQRSDDRVRITVQLIDATTGYHLWAENYDRKLKDIFALQDEIAMKIMTELQVTLSGQDWARLSPIKTNNLNAYETFLKGVSHFNRRTEADSLKARKLAQEAIALDPEYGAAYLLLGWTHLDDIWFQRTKDRAKSLQTAEQLARKVIELSGHDATTHRFFATVFMVQKQYEKAIVEAQKAVESSPNSARSHFVYGMVLNNVGRFEEAIPIFKKAIRLNPVTPIQYLNNLAWAYMNVEQYEKAISLWNKAIKRNPDYLFGYTGLTIAYQWSGQEMKAREAAAEVLRIKPAFSISLVKKTMGYKNEGIDKRILEAYRKAGIPEHSFQQTAD